MGRQERQATRRSSMVDSGRQGQLGYGLIDYLLNDPYDRGKLIFVFDCFSFICDEKNAISDQNSYSHAVSCSANPWQP